MKKQTGKYVDGFVLVVPKNKTADYKKMAELGKKAWMKHGALEYMECMMDDGKPAHVTLPFAKMIQAKPSETVWFSYIVFKSRKHRDQVNKKVMTDPAMNDPMYTEKNMPMDMKRFAYGGFQVVVSG